MLADTAGRAGLIARLLRHPCPVCEQHKHHRDPYTRARPGCPEWWHRHEYGRWRFLTQRRASRSQRPSGRAS